VLSVGDSSGLPGLEADLFLMPGERIAIEGVFADAFSIMLYGQQGTADPCACSPTGLSGGARFEFKGCASNSGQSWNSNNKPWCYVNGGVQCTRATPVAANPGGAWRFCSSGTEAALAASRDILFSFSPNPRNGTIARNDAPFTFPCTAPTLSATRSSTTTMSPSSSPTSPVKYLFAVLTSTSCAETLRGGPNNITSDTSAYLSTAFAGTVHSRFEQVFKLDGRTTLFTIQWTFMTEKTLQQRFVDAVCLTEPESFLLCRARLCAVALLSCIRTDAM
jgi:hypothetical protein